MLLELESQFINYVDVQEDDVALRESLVAILTWAEDYIYSTYYVAVSPRTIVETFDGSGSNKIYTTRGNIQSITSLVVSDEVIPTVGLKINKNTIFYPDGTFTAGTYNVDITYTIGYSTFEAIPAGLVNALFVIGRKIFQDTTKNFDTYTMIQSDTKQAVKPVDSIPYLAESILQAYRIFKF